MMAPDSASGRSEPTEDVGSDRTALRTAARAFEVLETLSVSASLTVTEISRLSGLPRATVTRMATTLEKLGYVVRDKPSKRYHLTKQVLKLSAGVTLENIIADEARPIVERASRATMWPLALASPRGLEMEVLVSTDFDNPYTVNHFTVGQRNPMVETATARVFLGFCDPSKRDHLFDALRASGVDRELLSIFSADVRTSGLCGYSVFQKAGRPEKVLAVPILRDKHAVAALCIRYFSSIVADSDARKDLLPILQSTAYEISPLLIDIHPSK